MKKFAVIVPVYNRPNEVEELLGSLAEQTNKNFKIYIIEDGSKIDCKHIVDRCQNTLDIAYFDKPNSGPGSSRNFGAKKSVEPYLVFFDSDCIIPPKYFSIVEERLAKDPLDAYGGPDAAHPKFSDFQKAINYSMTSFLTTGGIRGGSEQSEKFHPRSFNMGYSRRVFNSTQGFGKMRFGEDIDMSIRIMKAGFQTGLIKEAFVYHNRRSTLKQFYKQVHNSGIARINLFKLHPRSLKLVHYLPSLYTIGLLVFMVLGIFVHRYFLLPILGHYGLIFVDSAFKNKSIGIGLLSVVTSSVQLVSYGFGFIRAYWKRVILGKSSFSAYEKTFYE